ncbi:MAG: hypothetical protein M1815_005410 [Lichina confinis]|nr:MAG: hypothetical protein M1815_005410 [Lichina confinis]
MKRSHEGLQQQGPDGDERARKKAKTKKGFSVGPANLPDGTYRRKVEKIKKSLIHRAKVKKQYAKIKEAELKAPSAGPQRDRDDDDAILAGEGAAQATKSARSTEVDLTQDGMHPDRQAIFDEDPEGDASRQASRDEADSDVSRQPHERQSRKRQTKVAPFHKESQVAARRKAEAEARRHQRDEDEARRQRRLEERERTRKAMARARTGGKNGQRKLGRESRVLLDKVRRLVGGDE